jgi:general secretion pathway protein G
MTFSTYAARRRGFTLIELLIVIVVIAILALIVIPRVMGAGRKAKEASLKANLHQLRNAIEQFQADTGCYPKLLTDLVAAEGTNVTPGTDSAGVDVAIPNGSYKGPYLSGQGGLDNSGIPINPFWAGTMTNIATDAPANWTLDKGIVHPTVPADGETLDKILYQNL